MGIAVLGHVRADGCHECPERIGVAGAVIDPKSALIVRVVVPGNCDSVRRCTRRTHLAHVAGRDRRRQRGRTCGCPRARGSGQRVDGDGDLPRYRTAAAARRQRVGRRRVG